MTPGVVNAYVDGRDLLVLERGEDGVVHERRERPEHSFFVKRADLTPEMERGLRSSRAMRALRFEGEWVRVVWADDWVRKSMIFGRRGEEGRPRTLSPFQANDVTIFEGDVDPVRRWFTDTAEVRMGSQVRGYFDLETDSRVPIKLAREGKARILSIALATEDESTQWLGVLEADTDEAERALVQEFFDRVDAAGMSQLIAWGGDSFDFPCLQGRIDRLAMRVDRRRYLWLDHLAMFRRMNLNSSDSGDEKQSMALQAIAMAQLGEGKEVIPPEVAKRWPGQKLGALSWQLWEAGGAFRELLGRYNMKDTLLMCRIERKTAFAALFDAIAQVCRVLPDSIGLRPTSQVDGFMLRLGLERGYHFPTHRWRDEKTDPFKGAFVMEPKKKGILRGVHVADFASLYPSVIITWNMSPETKRPIPVNGPIPPGHCRCPRTGIGFSTEKQGMLPLACVTFKKLRKQYSDLEASLPPGTPEAKAAKRMSMAYKVAINSFYGVIGSPSSRYFDREVAESVTQNAVWLIQRTISEAELRAMDVFYGDTDSFFVLGCSRTEFEAFVRWSNEALYPEMLAGVGAGVAANTNANAIELAYEKEFDTVVLVGKKRYAGRFKHFKGTPGKPVPKEGEAFDKEKHSRPEIKGFEYKRGDSSVLARRLQERVIMALMRDDFRPATYRRLAEEMLDYVARADLPLEEVQISQTLTKEIKDYGGVDVNGRSKAPPTHARVAAEMEAEGEEIGDGSKVAYVIIDGSDGIKAVPSSKYEGELDRYYLWEHQVYPATQRILDEAFADENWRAGLERIRPGGRGRPLAGQAALFAEVRDPIGEAMAERAQRHHAAVQDARERAFEEEIAWRESA